MVDKESKQKRYQRKHKEMGLCLSCSRPSTEGSVYCSIHRETYIKIKERRKEEGKCPQCSNELMEEDLLKGLTYCTNCRQRIKRPINTDYYQNY